VSWRVLGASVRGVRHLRDGTPCQDAHAWRALPDGRVALAVADGAGSAAHAEAGAGAAARVARFAPARRGGQPVAMQVEMPFPRFPSEY